MTQDDKFHLTILQEECAETIYIISKMLRFGEKDFNPSDATKTTNIENFVKELADIQAVVELLKTSSFIKIDTQEFWKLVEAKKAKILYFKNRGQSNI